MSFEKQSQIHEALECFVFLLAAILFSFLIVLRFVEFRFVVVAVASTIVLLGRKMPESESGANDLREEKSVVGDRAGKSGNALESGENYSCGVGRRTK